MSKIKQKKDQQKHAKDYDFQGSDYVLPSRCVPDGDWKSHDRGDKALYEVR